MRACIVLSVAATLTVIGIASSEVAFAKGGSHGHSARHVAPAPSIRNAPAKARLTSVPSKPKIGSSAHRHRRVIRVVSPYDTTPVCVQILKNGRRVRVACSADVLW